MVERIDNVGVAVRDLQAAESFYTRLGFRVESRDETPGALLVAGDARLYLFQTNRPEGGARRSPDLVGNPPGIDHISFWVGDVDAAYRRLAEQGLTFATEPADQDWGARACSLHDPDGNVIFLLGPLSEGRAEG
ncbi:VOC family protein [Thermaerobacter subterraneus]|uniref:Ring-cleavage extradiol dioxygenase n=1 Tax=Thermaerobacter subterraneus DSM 13965 TaxID=867903 RepID=K6Q2F1_9FIRM|nr:VOC family protein [Thermaerobacter subterraneus]EKP95383.1 putative ring-cleavage extradiol dioxygenase [Thermaerobacter subterraneus DSM 13965]